MPGFIESLKRDPEKRDRLFATVFLVGIFAALPIPVAGKSTPWLVALSLLWLTVGALAWSAYFRPTYVAMLWLLSFFLSSFLFWRYQFLVPVALLVLWALWQGARARRFEGARRQVPLWLFVGSSLLFAAVGSRAQQPDQGIPGLGGAPIQIDPSAQAQPAAAQPVEASAPSADLGDIVIPVDQEAEKKKKEMQKQAEENALLAPPKEIKLNKEQRKKRDESIEEFKRSRAELKRSVPKPSEVKKPVVPTGPIAPSPESVVVPKYMNGYIMNDITSCAVIDRIPWKFRPDQRKTRLIVKDYFRFQSQTKFYSWEIYQVMDRQGYISYIVRRPISSGRYESLIVKDTAYNRVIEDPKNGPKIIESQDLKTLINRETLVFYHASGSTISYLPSSIGNSVLTLSPSSQNGRQLAPIFLRGSICDRPSDISDEDNVQKSILNDRKQPSAAVPGVK